MSSVNNKNPPVPPLVPISHKVDSSLCETNAKIITIKPSNLPLPLLIPLASKPPLKRGVSNALDEPVVIMPTAEEPSLEPQQKEDALAEQRLVIDLAELDTLEEALQTEEEPELQTAPPAAPAAAAVELTNVATKLKKEDKYKCGHCECRLPSLAQLKGHETLKHGIQHFYSHALAKDSNVNFLLVCDLCRMLLPNLRALNAHKKNHAPVKEKFFKKCYMCIKFFYCPKSWNKHVGTHKPDDPIHPPEVPTVCPTCSKEIPIRKKMMAHLRAHKVDRSVLCNECGMISKDPRSFRAHQERHSRVFKYECGDCPRRFVTETDRLSHRKNIHKPHKHICGDCKRTFTRPNLLRKHISFYHSDDHPPYNCDLCEKSFEKRSSLVFHRRQHKGIKPLKPKRKDPYNSNKIDK
ncbi:hypothetical protein KR044_007145 [Drosophila immigrans]|nr:hypothetical protein KR044_007145 [Drosophila immigrans]